MNLFSSATCETNHLTQFLVICFCRLVVESSFGIVTKPSWHFSILQDHVAVKDGPEGWSLRERRLMVFDGIWWNGMDYGRILVWNPLHGSPTIPWTSGLGTSVFRIFVGSEIVNLPAASWKSLGWSRRRWANWWGWCQEGFPVVSETSKSWASYFTCLLNACQILVCFDNLFAHVVQSKLLLLSYSCNMLQSYNF